MGSRAIALSSSFDAKVVHAIAMLKHRSGSSLNEIAAAIHHLYPTLSPAFLVKIPAAVQQLFAKGVLLRRTTYSLAAPHSAAVGGGKAKKTQKKQRAPVQKAKKTSHAKRKAGHKGSRSPAKRKAGAVRVRASGAKKTPARKARSKVGVRVSKKKASALAPKKTTATNKRKASSKARAPITSAAHHSRKPRAKKAAHHNGKKAHAKKAARHANKLALAPKKTVATKRRRAGPSHRRRSRATKSAAVDTQLRVTVHKRKTKKAANKKTSTAHTRHHSKGHSVSHAKQQHSLGHRRSARIRSLTK